MTSPLLTQSAPFRDVTNILANVANDLAVVASPGEPDSTESLATDCAAPCETAALGSPGQSTSQDILASDDDRTGKAKLNRKAWTNVKRCMAHQAEEQAALPDIDAQQQMQEAVQVSLSAAMYILVWHVTRLRS